MKYFHYIIKGDEISEYEGEIQTVPSDFIEYRITLSGDSIYYKLTHEKITDVIGEAIHEPAAKRRVEDFPFRPEYRPRLMIVNKSSEKFNSLYLEFISQLKELAENKIKPDKLIFTLHLKTVFNL